MGGPRLNGKSHSQMKFERQAELARREENERIEELEEEKRGSEIFKIGDLVKRYKDEALGFIIENGYRSYFEVLVDGQAHKWRREEVELVQKASMTIGGKE